MKAEHRTFLLLVGPLVLLAVLWTKFYVQPRQDFLMEVSECTGADASQDAWTRCVRIVRERKTQNRS